MSKPDWATRLQRTFARKYDAGFAKGLMLGKAVATRDEQERIIKLLEIGGPIEQIICDYWGDPEFDKDDALVLIERAIKGEN